MGKSTKKRNCRKNKSMKKMKKGGDPNAYNSNDIERPQKLVDSTTGDQIIDHNNDVVRPVEPVNSTTGAPSVKEEKKSWWSSLFGKTGGRKNKH